MGKTVGIAELKANCTQLIAEMERDGEPITVTRRGTPVVTVNLIPAKKTKPLFGLMKSSKYRFDSDPSVPVASASEWSALD